MDRRQLPDRDLDEFPISFCERMSIWVIVGPLHDVSQFGLSTKLHLTVGIIKQAERSHSKMGESFRATFMIDTSTFDFVDTDFVYLSIVEY